MHDDNRAEREAAAQLEHIRGLVREDRAARERGEGEDEALEAILDDALSVSVRSDWRAPDAPDVPGEYQILLSWGGPASRIVGDLDHGQAMTARLEYQDWFTPWEPLTTSREDDEALLAYARCFYFG